MQSTERAVVRLTEDHTEMTEGGAVEWPPLLVWLESAVTEIVGRKGGGAGGAGVPLNADALDLLQFIDRRVRMMREALHLPSQGGRVKDTAVVWEATVTERKGGRMDDEQWERITDELGDWVTRIEALYDRPRKMEVTVPCPRCEERWMLDANGDRVAAVAVEFAEGRAPVAECRVDGCAAMWVGWADVARLGFTLGAAQDMAVLAACGIDAPMIDESYGCNSLRKEIQSR